MCFADVVSQGQSIIRALMTQYYLTVGCAQLVQVLSVTAKRVVLARYFEHTGRKFFHRHDFEPICTCGCDFDDAGATGSSHPRYSKAEINQGFGSLPNNTYNNSQTSSTAHKTWYTCQKTVKKHYSFKALFAGALQQHSQHINAPVGKKFDAITLTVALQFTLEVNRTKRFANA